MHTNTNFKHHVSRTTYQLESQHHNMLRALLRNAFNVIATLSARKPHHARTRATSDVELLPKTREPAKMDADFCFSVERREGLQNGLQVCCLSQQVTSK